jgi:hypothetical protein
MDFARASPPPRCRAPSPALRGIARDTSPKYACSQGKIASRGPHPRPCPRLAGLPLPSSRRKPCCAAISAPRRLERWGPRDANVLGLVACRACAPALTYADACCAGCRTRRWPSRGGGTVEPDERHPPCHPHESRLCCVRPKACAAGVCVRERRGAGAARDQPQHVGIPRNPTPLWARRGIATAQGDSHDEGNGKPRGGGRDGDGGTRREDPFDASDLRGDAARPIPTRHVGGVTGWHRPGSIHARTLRGVGAQPPCSDSA